MPSKTELASSIFLAALTVLTAVLGFFMFKPFLKPLFLASVLAIVAHPLYHRVLKRMKRRPYLAATLCTALITLLILLPAIAMLAVVASQSLELYQQATQFVQDGGIEKLTGSQQVLALKSTIERYLALAGAQNVDLKADAVGLLKKLSTYLIGLGQKAATNFFIAAGQFAIVIFALFFFFVDGDRLVAYLMSVSPLSEIAKRRLSRRFVDVIHASFIGSFGVAAAQGVLGGLAFTLVGLPGFFWGLVMAFASLIPVVGTALVWIPGGIVLLAMQRWWAGIFILAWGVGVVSSVDNFLRPWLMKGRSGLHPLAIFISILGGVSYFGGLGIIFGPMVASLGLTLMDIFRQEFIATTES